MNFSFLIALQSSLPRTGQSLDYCKKTQNPLSATIQLISQMHSWLKQLMKISLRGYCVSQKRILNCRCFQHLFLQSHNLKCRIFYLVDYLNKKNNETPLYFVFLTIQLAVNTSLQHQILSRWAIATRKRN